MVCMQYHFKKGDNNKIIFVKMEEIFEMDLTTEQITVIYKFQIPLLAQPMHFEMDVD